VVSARLYALLRIPDCLQDSSAIIEVVRIEVLLFAEFRQQYTNLVRDIANSIVGGSLAPIGKLGSDGKTFFCCGFVGLDQVVLGFYQLVQLLAQFGLDGSAEGTKAEAMTTSAG
jgi:hypothetical protein